MLAATQIHPVSNVSKRGSFINKSNPAKVASLRFQYLAEKASFAEGAKTLKLLSSVKTREHSFVLNTDGHASVSMPGEEETRQVIVRAINGKIHWKNTLQQLERVGPKSVGVCLLTAAFVGMAFTIQFVREFTRLGLNRSIGGVLALAFSRELSPVVTSIVVAGRIGSAFAAELGTMQVSEQTDTLRVLGANPVDYLVTPRVLASCIALPLLTLMCFTVGLASSALLADSVYGISINIILDSAQRALRGWDIISAMIKSTVFGAIISIVSCAWGVTTLGGAKGVGESTTSAVVVSLVGIFIADFALSCCFFQGAGDSLKNCM
ncbi:Protein TRIGALACTOSYLDIACYLGLYCEROL 1, chloroplastic [Salvia divinorum]|uniref:Protein TRIGALACTOSYLDIACYLGLYCEROL 1, chloroplastic n=1 Tax=Salvia divinorum TaxID=28513 RepID=A0ABD1HVQ1_SALDI